MEINNLSLLIFMAVCALWDFFKKNIPIWLLICGGLAVTVSVIIADRLWPDGVLGLLPGIIMLVVAICFKSVGLADAWIILFMGLGIGIWGAVFVIICALFMTIIVGGIWAFIKKKGLKQEIPFVPFLFAAQIVYLLMQV